MTVNYTTMMKHELMGIEWTCKEELEQILQDRGVWLYAYDEDCVVVDLGEVNTMRDYVLATVNCVMGEDGKYHPTEIEMETVLCTWFE